MHAYGWAILLAATAFIGITKSGFGSGVGLMIVPMTTLGAAILGWPADTALGMLLPLLVLGDLIAVWQYRHLFSLNIVKHLLPGTLIGVIIGGFALRFFHKQTQDVAAALIQIDIGLESVALVSLHWWRMSRGDRGLYVPKGWHNWLVGGLSAISSTMAHAAGPIVALYLLPQRLERQLFVGTCAIYFAILNTAKLPVYAKAGLFHDAPFTFSLRFLPLVIGGAVFGLWLNKRMNDKVFSKIVYILTFAMGWYILVEGIAGLHKARLF